MVVSLDGFLERGKQSHEIFMNTKLSIDKSKSFLATEKRVRVHTFADNIENQQDKSTKLTIDFRRLLAVSKKCEVDLQYVLKHELAAISSSLFLVDGSMQKTTKADLAKKLEATGPHVYPLLVIEGTTGYIVDGMSLLHQQDEATFSTFRILQIEYCSKSLRY